MRTWEQGRRLPLEEAHAELGLVTLGGDPAGVLVGGERRWLPVYGPGGYCWRPAAGDRVLVLKAGSEGETPCPLGTVQTEEELKPGEVCLSGGGCRLKLGQDALELQGSILLNGERLEDCIARVVSDLLNNDSGEGE